jgi:hypothetical protein
MKGSSSHTNKSRSETDNEEDELVSGIQSLSLTDKDINVSHSLIGSYSWKGTKQVYIPGFPAQLKRDFQSIYVGLLPETPGLTKEEVHPNEFLHNIYFEPIEEVFKHQGREGGHQPRLDDFDLITDRNNLLKVDAALCGNREYKTDFEILLRRRGKLIIAKRMETIFDSPRAGKEFEKVLCEPSPFTCCHAIVHTTVKTPSTTYNLLVRSEVDCCDVNIRVPSIGDYTQHHLTPSGLSVYHTSSTSRVTPPRLNDFGEVTMIGHLEGKHNYFQCWLGGIQWIAHGVNRRLRGIRRVEVGPGIKERLVNVIKEFQGRGNEMEENATYYLKRVEGGQLQFGRKEEYNVEWFGQPLGEDVSSSQ